MAGEAVILPQPQQIEGDASPQAVSRGQSPSHGSGRHVPGTVPGTWPELPPEGYELTLRDGEATIEAGDAAGAFYAEQTLRQLRVRDIRIRDWPRFPIRGVIEGFYGPPWTHRERLDVLDFCGRMKLNLFVYAPKDDPFHRARWRDPYPQSELDQLTQLVEEGRRRHVDVAYAIAPGLSICYSDGAEFQALVAKAEQLWAAGVRSFQLLYDDIDNAFNCEADAARFDSTAAAQAHLTNRFLDEFLRPRPDAGRLVIVPIEYAGVERSPYRQAIADLVDPDVLVYWTGSDVVVPEISRADLDAAAEALGHELLLWDNYPVNDFEPTRMILGPLRGRSLALADGRLAGIVANPMVQARPSLLPLATVADYAWNPQAYDPDRSWMLAVRDVGVESLRAALAVARSQQ